MTPQQEKIAHLMSELHLTAIGIRDDWSSFDGRDLLRDVTIWLKKLSDVTDIRFENYYTEYYKAAIQGRWNIDISENWRS